MKTSVNHIRQESADVKAIYLVLVIAVVLTALLAMGCDSGNAPFQGDSTSGDSTSGGTSSPPSTSPPDSGGDTPTTPPAPPTGGDTDSGLRPPDPPIL